MNELTNVVPSSLLVSDAALPTHMQFDSSQLANLPNNSPLHRGAMTVSTNEAGQQIVSHHTVSKSASSIASAPGILSTAKNPNGSQAMGVYTPQSIVSTPMGTMTIASAVSIGLVVHDGNGYRDVGTAPIALPAATQDAEPTAAPTALVLDSVSAEAESFLGSIMQSHEFDGMINTIIDQSLGLTDRGIDTRAISAALGGAIKPEQLNSTIIHVGKAYQSAIDSIIRSAAGVDPHTAYDWMKANRPREMKEALQTLFHGKSTAGLRALATQFKNSSGNTVTQADRDRLGDSIQSNSGFLGNTGETIVIQGMEMTLATAKRMGLI
jgi:hypothetical protein